MNRLEMIKMPPPVDIKINERGYDATVITADGAEYCVGDHLGRTAYYGFIYAKQNRSIAEGWVSNPQVIATIAKYCIGEVREKKLKVMALDEALAYIREKGIQTYPFEAKAISFEDKNTEDGEVNAIESYEVLEEWTPREVADFREKGWA